MAIKCVCQDCKDDEIARRRKRRPGGRPKHGRKARKGEKPWLDKLLNG